MTKTDITFGTDARELIRQGAEAVFKAVSATLGPRGRNVLIEQHYGDPKLTKDGVTVAKSINLEGIPNIGASTIKAAAAQANEDSGDGTTTATVLAYHIYNGGLKMLDEGVNPTDLKRGIDLATEEALKQVGKVAVQVTQPEQVAHIGTISANGDREIGEKISEAVHTVGLGGVVTVEPGSGLGFELEVVLRAPNDGADGILQIESLICQATFRKNSPLAGQSLIHLPNMALQF